MNKILFLFSILCISLQSISQQPDLSWNSANTKPAKQIDVEIAGYTADGYYVVNKKPASGMEFSPTIVIEYFNAGNERVFVKDVTPTRQEDYVNVVYFNESLYLVSSLFTKESGKNILTATAILRSGSLDKPVQIGELSAEKMSARGRFNVAASPDGSKLLVLSQTNYTKDANEKIGIALFEKGFTKTYSSEQTYSYAWTKAVDNAPYVNNQGMAFILKKTDMKGDDNTFSVFSFDGKALKEFKIAMEGKRKVATIVQAFSPEGDFTVGGYYTEEGKFKAGIGNALHGTFLYRIDKAGVDAKIAQATPFDKRKDIIARRIIFHGNNSILMGERYYVSSQAPQRDPSKPMTNENMFERDYSYYGVDIIVDAFDATGKFLYYAKVDKDNTSRNDNGTWVSYFAAVIKDKILIIFNDDKYKYDDKKRIFIVGSPRIIVYTTIDPATGTVAEAQPIPNTGPVGGKGADMLMRPDVFLQTGENQFVIRAENPSIYRMGKMSF